MKTFKHYLLAIATFVPLLLPGASSAQPLEPYEVMHPLSGAEGADPQGGLVRGADDRLYGTATCSRIEDSLGNVTYPCGVDVAGTIFSITPNGPLLPLHTFRNSLPRGGLNPVGLMRGRDNHLYGTTSYGGTDNSARLRRPGDPVGNGVIYKLEWNGSTYSAPAILHSFDCANGEGGDPWAAPTEGPDGALYGVTLPSNEPDEACGNVSTIYKVNKDGLDFRILARFDYREVGSYQFGPLVIGSDGSIYGTLVDSLNEAFRYGSIFRVSPQGDGSFLPPFYLKTYIQTETEKEEGRDPVEGAYPNSGLVRGPDGALYGTTYGGGESRVVGESGVGTIFKINEDGSGFRRLYSFRSDSIHTPYSALVIGGDGLIYGMAHGGGSACDCGGSYIFDPVAGLGNPDAGFRVHQLLDNDTTGSGPWGPLTVGADRHLYGTQTSGGAGGQGVLFGLGDVPGDTLLGILPIDMEVANRPPFPVVLASTVAVSPGFETVEFDARGSSDPDFDDLTYSWDLSQSNATDVIEADDHSTVTATFPEGPWSVTLTVSDQPDGSNPQSVTIQGAVVDAPPVFSEVLPISTPMTRPDGAIVNYTAPTAWDVADNAAPTVTCSPGPGLFPAGVTRVICRAMDSSGRGATTSFDVEVTTAVLITGAVDLTVEAAGPSGASVFFNVSATPGSLGVTCYVGLVPIQPGALFAIGHTTVNCESDVDPVTQEVARASFIVTVQDTRGPAITMDEYGIEFHATDPDPIGTLIDFNDPDQIGLWDGAGDVPVAYDDVAGVVPVICDPPAGSRFLLGLTLVTCTATDGVNVSRRDFYIQVYDADSPVVTVPSPITAEATGPAGAQVTFTVTATDHTSPEGVVLWCSHSSGATFPLGGTTVTCHATDASSIAWRSPDQSFLITIVDTTPPALDGVPDDITAVSSTPAGAAVPYTLPTALDIVDPVSLVTCSPASGATFQVGPTLVTCRATDAAGNRGEATFNVTVTDGVAPVVTVPGTITVEAVAPEGTAVTFLPAPTASDDHDGAVPVTCAPLSGSTFAIGTTAVTCGATDSSGNEGNSTFNVIVRDTIAPVLTVAEIVAEATGGSGAVVTFAPSAFDAVGVVGGVICVRPSGSLFPLGPTLVNCTARDAAGNTGAASFTVTVQDTTPPAITMPANMSLEATSPGGAVAVFAPTVVEAVGPVSVVCAPASGSTFPLGTTTVTCTATDAAGKSSSGAFQVTVRDTVGPVITVPENMTVVAAGTGGTAVRFDISVVDAVAVRTVGCNPASGATFPLGTTVVNCRALDSSGNISRASFTVTVVNKPPTLVVTLSPGVLWPPNHKMVTINATIVATTQSGPAPIVTLVSITSNEPDNGLGDGDTANDIQGATYGTNDRVFQLRAERSGKGNARVYTVTYKAALEGNPSIFTVVSATVTVPHDMNGKTK